MFPQQVTQRELGLPAEREVQGAAKQRAFDDLAKSSTVPVELAINYRSGTIYSVRGRFPRGGPQAPPEEIARKFLTLHAAIFGVPPDFKGLLTSPPQVVGGLNRVRVRQQYNDLPVFGAGFDVDVGPGGEVIGTCGNAVDGGGLATSP